MLVYFVRHGQSEGNKNNIHHVPETPLSEKGVEQAKTIAKRLKKIHFDLIYASPMTRAAKTAEIINETLNIPIEYWKGLAECGSPSEIRGKSVDDPEVVKIKSLISQNYHKSDWKYSDEETFNELNERIEGVLDHLEKHHNGESILCVSHSAFIESIVAKMLLDEELTPETLSKMKKHMYMENTGITICEQTGEYGWTLKTWSDTTHLK
jgi:broad specificity phosphatase PhoE